MAISEYLKYLRVPLDKLNMNNAEHHNNTFVVKSYRTVSKTNIPRIFTGITRNQFLLTGVSEHTNVIQKDGNVVRIEFQDEPNISIGMRLMSFGVPSDGIVVRLMVLPSPLDKNVVRVIINYITPIKAGCQW